MLQRLALGLSFALLTSTALAEPATQVLGNDYVFPNRIEGLPHKLSDFKDLQINRFKTSDGVELAYWGCKPEPQKFPSPSHYPLAGVDLTVVSPAAIELIRAIDSKQVGCFRIREI